MKLHLKKLIKYRALRILIRVIIGLLLFFALLVLFIRSPWGQGIIVDKAVSFVEDKTGTNVDIDKLYLTFSGNLSLKGLYLEDQNQDTLLYSQALEVAVGLLPLIKGDEINIKKVDWNGLKARVIRPEASESFNYQFLIDAFATPADSTVKDTTATTAPEINIGNVYFNNFDLIYADEPQGMLANLKLGSLALEVETLDLDKFIFEVDELSISNTQVNYELNKKAQVTQTTEEGNEAMQLPQLAVGLLNLENVRLNYKSLPDFTEAELDLDELILELPLADLNTQKIVLDELTLNNSKVVYRQTAAQADQPQGQAPPTSTQPIAFEWPDWNVEAKNISLANNALTLQTANTYLESGVFNPEWIDLQGLTFETGGISLKPDEANFELHNLAFKERSGLMLQSFAFDLSVDESELLLEDLAFVTPKNSLSGNIVLGYTSINQLINSPELANLDLNLNRLKLDPAGFSAFSPALAKNEYLQKLSNKELIGSLAVAGKVSDLSIDKFSLAWGDSTDINFVGRIQHLTDTDLLKASLQDIDIRSARKDIVQFIEEDSLGLELPKQLRLQGNATANLNSANADLRLNTSLGNISVNGDFSQSEPLAFKADLSAEKLQLRTLLQNDQLDTLSFEMKIEGSGTELSDLDAKLSTSFERLTYNGYDFSNLEISGALENGEGDVKLAFKDENLDMTMLTQLALDSVSPKVNTKLIVKGADLFRMGLTQANIRTAFELKASYVGNGANFDIEAGLNDGVAIYNQEAYNFGGFSMKAKSAQDTLNVDIQSNTIDSKITANRSLNEIIPVFQRELEYYLNQPETVSTDSIDNNTVLNMDMVIRQTPIISEVFLQKLDRMDSISLDLNFNEQNHTITAELLAPYIQYQGSALDSLQLKLNGKNNRLDFLLSWAGVSAGSIEIDETMLKGYIDDGFVDSRLTVKENQSTLLNVGSEVRINSDTLQFTIAPDTLVFDSKEWQILDGNRISYATEYLKVENFELSNGQQKITLGTSLPNHEGEHVGAIFSNFNLTTITSLLNSEKPLAAGILNGDVILENPFGSYGITADLNIADLATLDVPLGEMNLDASAAGSDKYEAKLTIMGENMLLGLVGSYTAAEEGGDLSLDLDLSKLDMSIVEALSNDALSESEGMLSANVEISGTTTDPQYNGTLAFNQVGFLVNELNSTFRIANEQLEVNNAGLYLNDFVITDGDSNDFSLDGDILTESLTNPSFDLKLVANNFGVVNSTTEDSDLFYGDVSLDADLDITGDLEVPRVRGTLKIIDGSNLTFIIPESQAELKERDGVVVFVNKKNPDDILTRTSQAESSALAASLSGYDVETNFTIGENSEFKIIIDETTGDNLLVKGNGDFNLSLEPNGRTSLSGKYEVSGGHYEANLFNLVQRKFQIVSGSSISWGGDPYDADLDVRAMYDVETSAGPLMAVRTSAEGTALESSYQERLPFQVYINVEGQLLSPQISFSLDMPEDDRGALSGSVYSQVQQLNNQEEELNKQVFSLLVLNRFFPSSGSDGSNGGPASLAMDNVNKVLSSQLNTYSDKVFGSAVDVGFDLNSRSDSTGAPAQTQLGITARKQLFNERLIVQVGSEVDVAGTQNASQSTPIIGNISLEYLLTEDKRLRLKGFSKNQYEGVIDGQLTVSGIAIIFTREFNKFKELWAKQVKEEVEKGGNK
ncbi:MAG: hypothetical protein DCO95_08360 [Roseivirga sp. XM-24bin3]|nr:MAG: hypothetical protein DCO95_08360 [Roseivirga sp. XM-24bin3]